MNGTNGTNGINGLNGPVGPTGPTGAIGATGATGPTGTSGGAVISGYGLFQNKSIQTDIASGDLINLTYTGPQLGGFVLSGGAIVIPATGVYEITYRVLADALAATILNASDSGLLVDSAFQNAAPFTPSGGSVIVSLQEGELLGIFSNNPTGGNTFNTVQTPGFSPNVPVDLTIIRLQ